jgi:Protein of unknown function (DUF3025)
MTSSADDNITFQAINWTAPWLARYRSIGEPLAQAVISGSTVYGALNDALAANQHIHCPVRFVPQAQSQGAAAYESFIWKTKTVPTRDNLHDFFNGLVWLHFPAIKTRLNALQAAAIEVAGVVATRGKVRDALTLFDENAAFLIEKDSQWPLLQAIRDKAWQDTFVGRRMDWASAEVIVFGHALLEKLVTPRKAMTAHVFCSPAHITSSLDVDAQIAGQLTSDHLTTKPYAPLPVMGVPGWCADNEDEGFYNDASVFRAPKF